MAEPWPSEVLFTLGDLYPRQTGQHRTDCIGEDLGEGQVQTHTLTERAFSFICSIRKIWRRPGQAKCKWDSSPTMHDLPSQCKSEGSPGHGQTGEGNFGEGLVRLSVNRV